MSSRVVGHGLPFYAASDVPGLSPVAYFGGSGGIRTVVAAATVNQEPLGSTGEVGALGGKALTVHPIGQLVKAVCGATIVDGNDVGVQGFATAVGPSGAYQQVRLGPVSGASGSKVFRAGVACEAAVPGQIFTYFFSPRQLSGLA